MKKQAEKVKLPKKIQLSVAKPTFKPSLTTEALLLTKKALLVDFGI